jgi:PAS domain S-box-containing protein
MTDSFTKTKSRLYGVGLKNPSFWFSMVFNGCHDAIFIADFMGVFIDVNKAAENLTGYSKHDLLGMSFTNLTDKEEKKAYDSFLKSIVAGEEITSETEIRRKDGSYIPAKLFITRIVSGSNYYLYSVAGNSEAVAHCSELLSRSEEKFKIVKDNSPDRIIIHDKDLRYKYVLNPGLSLTEEDMYGFPGYIRNVTDKKETGKRLKLSTGEHRRLTEYAEAIREEERSKISLNLHDDLGQKLTALKMDVRWLKTKLGIVPELVNDKISEMSIILDDTVKAVQKISSELRPNILYDLGLQAAIEWQLNEFSKNTGTKSEAKIMLRDITVDEKLALSIYRIIQEALTNISRHAKASEVILKLISDNTDIRLVILDNGIGINHKKIVTSKSFGLMSMRERARTHGGNFQISGEKGKGTNITVTIPVGSGHQETVSMP